MHAFLCRDESALQQLGAALAQVVGAGGVIFLSGELGAGKTTLARALIQSLLPNARVKSPTYTLIEPYRTERLALFHLDLYRIAEAAELTHLGLEDLLAEPALLLVEWPERGQGKLPPCDLDIFLEHADPGRKVRLLARSELGHAWLEALNSASEHQARSRP